MFSNRSVSVQQKINKNTKQINNQCTIIFSCSTYTYQYLLQYSLVCLYSRVNLLLLRFDKLQRGFNLGQKVWSETGYRVKERYNVYVVLEVSSMYSCCRLQYKGQMKQGNFLASSFQAPSLQMNCWKTSWKLLQCLGSAMPMANISHRIQTI